MAQAKRDWLEPPAWWKKWRPLRLLLMGTLLICFAIVIRPLLNPDAQYVRPVRVQDPAVVAAADPVTAPKEELKSPTSEPDTTPATVAPAPTLRPAEAVPAAPEDATAADRPTSAASPPGTPLPSADTPEPKTASAEPEPAPAPAATKFTAMASPVNLLAPYRSYMSVDAVMTDLQQRGYLPLLESNHRPVRDEMPPHDVDTITVKEYSHWDQVGRLELVFFNDRLYQAEFEPADAAAYRAAQRKHLPEVPRERSGRSELVRGPLRIASSLDLAVSDVGAKLRSRAFLLWQDLRLIQQREEWDQRYALEAVTD